MPKYFNKIITLSLLISFFVFLVPTTPVQSAEIGEKCTSFQDCPINNMCVYSGMSKRCYPKIGGGCNSNNDCSHIEEHLGIPGAFCDLSKPVLTYPGSCFSASSAPKTTTDDGCSWRIERLVPGATGSFQGGCYSIEEKSSYDKCSTISQPQKNTGETLYCCCQKEKETAKVKTPDLNPLGNLQIKIPGLEELAEKYPVICEKKDGSEVCKIPWIAVYIYAIYNYLLGIGGILAALALMIGGVIWLISAGNANRVTQAQSWITGSITGLVILLTSYVLLYQINPNLVGMKYLELESVLPLACAGIDETNENPYIAGCAASKNGDFSICRAFGETEANSLITDPVSGKKVNTDTLNKFNEAMKCVKAKNSNKDLFKIYSGWRSALGQIKAKEDWIKAGVPKNAANPCCSNHGSGKAMDLMRLDGQKMSWDYNESSGLKECMNAQGLYANLSSEPWHWSPTGK